MQSRPYGWERQRSVVADVNHCDTILLAQCPLPPVPLLYFGESLFPAKPFYWSIVLLSLMLNSKLEFWEIDIKPLLS